MLATEASRHALSLLVHLGSRLCALPLMSVAECMRPLPIEEVPGAPGYLLGLSIIRGAPVPVVSLSRLVEDRHETPNRFVVLRLAERRVALAVAGVVGVRRLESSLLHTLPPLLAGESSDSLSAIGVVDEQLLYVLQTASMIPEDVWRLIEPNGRGC